MINTKKIKAGDKVHLRDGSVIVVNKQPDGLYVAASELSEWCGDGCWLYGRTDPLDIIRVEKAPKPVVETYWLSASNGFCDAFSYRPAISSNLYKITITDGEATIERVK